MNRLERIIVHVYSDILLFWPSTIIMQIYSAERNEDTGIPTHWKYEVRLILLKSRGNIISIFLIRSIKMKILKYFQLSSLLLK